MLEHYNCQIIEFENWKYDIQFFFLRKVVLVENFKIKSKITRIDFAFQKLSAMLLFNLC